MTTRTTLRLVALGMVLASAAHTACVSAPDPTVLPQNPDLSAFSRQVQPVYEARCASSSCHGAEGRPLALFARHMRRDPAIPLWSDATLTTAELQANLQATLPFVRIDAPSASELLTKPLAATGGGVPHAPGPVFEDRFDSDYTALLRWITTLAEVAP